MHQNDERDRGHVRRSDLEPAQGGGDQGGLRRHEARTPGESGGVAGVVLLLILLLSSGGRGAGGRGAGGRGASGRGAGGRDTLGSKRAARVANSTSDNRRVLRFVVAVEQSCCCSLVI